MTASKFTELLDPSTQPPYTDRNVSLDDILAETRRRSSSGSSAASSQSASSGAVSPTTPAKLKPRRFTLGSKRRAGGMG